VLKLLPPPIRLVFVALTTSGFVFITSVRSALAAVLFSGLCYVLSGRHAFWRPIFIVVLPTTILFFLGNLFLPAQDVLSLTRTSTRTLIEVAGAHSLRIAAVLLLSVAWLRTTPLPQLYASLAWFRPTAPYVLGTVRGLQLTARDFVTSAQSLVIRGFRIQSLPLIIFRGNWSQLRRNIDTFLAILRAVVPRLLQRIAGGTLSWDRHYPKLRSHDHPCEIAISFAGVYVRYRHSAPVLNDVTVEIPAGQAYLIVGPARSGKSTFLRSAAGVVPRLMGEIAGGVAVLGVPLEDLTLGQCLSLAVYVEADPATAILGLTVRQEIALLAADNSEVERVMRLMGLEELADREVTRLSGGEQMRLVLAGVLATRARVTLLDEPLSQLDTSGRRDFVAALRDFLDIDRSRTIIVAEYRSSLLASTVENVVMLDDGRVTVHTSSILEDREIAERCGLLSALPDPPKVEYLAGDLIASMTDVYLTLEGVQILRGVSLEIRERECILIRGPNGGGKTTAMLTLAGALKPSSGRVQCEGDVGYVFQDVRLQAVTGSAGSEVALAGRLRGWSQQEIESSTAEWLSWCGVAEDAVMTDLHEQDLRLVSAAAMATTAKIVVLDEPTVGMDMDGVRRILDFVSRCRSVNKAVVVISHDDVFVPIASRLLTLSDGRVTDLHQL
jgi:energy-coupling factor transporter ATP-binding protein EcfA2